jgi:outer membrane biosynthesis protein TonB
MNLRQVIPTDVAASAIVHLSLLALVFVFSEVHPFGAVTAEPIAVDIVTPKEIAENTPEPAPTPAPPPDFSAPDKPASPSAAVPSPSPPVPAPSPAPARPQKLAASRPAQPQPAAPSPPTPAYAPPEPDLSIKYHVLLGLPQDMPQTLLPRSGEKAGDNFDAPANQAADVASSLVAEFRRHLKTCAKLPASIAASDDVKVKLRVFMTPEGRLATDPILIEASASMKGPLLLQGAISALQACQPYAMLPVDRYGEWKILDLGFTPRDF